MSAPGRGGSVAGGRTTVTVGRGDRSYAVVVAPGCMAELPSLIREHVRAHRWAIVSDDRVAPLYAAPLADAFGREGMDARVLSFPAGEASKTRERWSALTDAMLDGGFGRDACVVAVGGGVTTDLAGFVAATFMRGVPVVQVPTSYLAMIDASVGGKTGVDTRHGKNLVGAFHPPALVAVDPEVLSTLAREERAEGLVEAFKHGAILDAAYLGRLEEAVGALLEADPAAALDAVTRSIELKAAVVTEDEREGGYRQILNFGHTVGHAVEAAADFRVGHGTAVALGMIAEALLGEALGVTTGGTTDRLQAALGGLGLRRPDALTPDRIAAYLAADKKARGGRARYVLLARAGAVDRGEGWTHQVDDEAVLAAFGGALARF